MDDISIEEEVAFLQRYKIIQVVDDAVKGKAVHTVDTEPVQKCTVRGTIKGIRKEVRQLLDKSWSHSVVNQDKEMLTKKVKNTRRRADEICEAMATIRPDSEQGKFLLQSFTANIFGNFKQHIASRVFRKDTHQITWISRLCLILLPAYIIFVLFYVFLFGVSLGAKTTNAWLAGFCVAFVQEVLLFTPFKLWSNDIVISSVIYDDVAAVSMEIEKKAGLVMLRSKGLMNEIDLIHHLNPACRAARRYPHLPVSRLLMSLRDTDIEPVRSHHHQSHRIRARPWHRRPRHDDAPSTHSQPTLTNSPKSGSYNFFTVIGVCFIFIVTLFPDYIMDVILDVLETGVMAGIILAIAAAGEASFIAGIVVIVVSVLLCAFYYMYVKNHHQTQENAKNADVESRPRGVSSLESRNRQNFKEKWRSSPKVLPIADEVPNADEIYKIAIAAADHNHSHKSSNIDSDSNIGIGDDGKVGSLEVLDALTPAPPSPHKMEFDRQVEESAIRNGISREASIDHILLDKDIVPPGNVAREASSPDSHIDRHGDDQLDTMFLTGTRPKPAPFLSNPSKNKLLKGQSSRDFLQDRIRSFSCNPSRDPSTRYLASPEPLHEAKDGEMLDASTPTGAEKGFHEDNRNTLEAFNATYDKDDSDVQAVLTKVFAEELGAAPPMKKVFSKESTRENLILLDTEAEAADEESKS
jgi:hypothetical protein